MTFLVTPSNNQQERELITFLDEQEINYFKRQTLQEYNQELEKAMAAIDRGEFITHEEVKLEMKNW